MKAMHRGVRNTIVAALLSIVVLLGLLVNKILAPRLMSEAELRNNGAVVLQPARRFALQGLTDQHREVFDRSRLEGQWSLVFFGYTYCPDVCPTTLATLKRFTQMIEGERFSEDLQVVLLTVDPARDTPQQLAPYMAYFDEQFIAITGDFLNVYRTANALNAAFNKRLTERPGEYWVDHSANIALINPRGDYHALLLPPFEAGKLRLLYRSIRAEYEYRYDS
ncbi:protein SCO1/2 [Sinobacterium caligoides]|uniref:Protein SCO1/2 n=1 Tax=Sinobacterium caligoides TaxID=933926 RepID=A0A3N2DGS1_9GAMM|nr:SCO family protein [Sinobacterium caligoides]ROR98972.1 protein SCO1/2 [Sinobacterium caligoides]